MGASFTLEKLFNRSSFLILTGGLHLAATITSEYRFREYFQSFLILIGGPHLAAAITSKY